MAEVRTSVDVGTTTYPPVAVEVRIRPVPSDEAKEQILWEVGEGRGVIVKKTNKLQPHKYQFDAVYGPDSRSTEVYEKQTRDIVLAACNGFNGTIFAYGEQGSGKSFTIFGSKNTAGLVQLAAEDIFNFIDSTPEREFKLKLSCFEVDDKRVRDILNDGKEVVPVEVKSSDDESSTPYCVSEVAIASMSDFKAAFEKCQKLRHLTALTEEEEGGGEELQTAETLSAKPFKAHNIMRLRIFSQHSTIAATNLAYLAAQQGHEPDCTCCNPSPNQRECFLTFGDLSEQEAQSEVFEYSRFATSKKMMDVGLVGLSQVLLSLSNGESLEKIPYNSSVLTKALKRSLHGQTQMLFVCTVIPSSLHDKQTESTLQFGSFTRQISNTIRTNQVVDVATNLARHMRMYNSLKSKLAAYKTRFKSISNAQDRLQEQYNDLDINYEKLKRKYEETNNLLRDLQNIGVESAAEGDAVDNLEVVQNLKRRSEMAELHLERLRATVQLEGKESEEREKHWHEVVRRLQHENNDLQRRLDFSSAQTEILEQEKNDMSNNFKRRLKDAELVVFKLRNLSLEHGTVLLKVQRKTLQLHRCRFWLDAASGTLHWKGMSVTSRTRSLNLNDVIAVHLGQYTRVFLELEQLHAEEKTKKLDGKSSKDDDALLATIQELTRPEKSEKNRSFSLVTLHRTVDIIAPTVDLFKLWVEGLSPFLSKAQTTDHRDLRRAMPLVHGQGVAAKVAAALDVSQQRKQQPVLDSPKDGAGKHGDIEVLDFPSP